MPADLRLDGISNITCDSQGSTCRLGLHIPGSDSIKVISDPKLLEVLRPMAPEATTGTDFEANSGTDFEATVMLEVEILNSKLEDFIRHDKNVRVQKYADYYYPETMESAEEPIAPVLPSNTSDPFAVAMYDNDMTLYTAAYAAWENRMGDPRTIAENIVAGKMSTSTETIDETTTVSPPIIIN